MTSVELRADLYPDWTDSNGLVKSNKGQTDSDNGVLYTCIYWVMTGEWLNLSSVYRCFKARGLLQRRPGGSSQDQFDNYLGLAIGMAYSELNDLGWCSSITKYGIKHFGFYNNTDSFLWSAFLWRFPVTFLFMFAAGWPKLKWLVWPLLTLYCSFLNPKDLSDSSGLQLQWLCVKGHTKLYGSNMRGKWGQKFIINLQKPVCSLFEAYYGADHPYTQYARDNTV